MALNRFSTPLLRLLAVWVAVAGLMASEHHGTVKSGGLPVPGATVTATKGDERHVTTTDENGRYAFADLKDGVWKIEVEMLGFTRLSNEVGIAFDAPAPEWSLKFLPLSAIVAPPPANIEAAAKPAEQPAAAPAKAPATANVAPVPAAPAANANGNARGNQNGGRGGRGQNGTANGGRPSLQQAMNNFQRVDVNASGDLAAAGDAGNIAANEMADLSGSASDALSINGSLSRGLEGGGQNDWFGGPGGRPMDGMGGPMGMMGMGMGMTPGGGDGMANAGGDGMANAGGGRGGRGGPGGGPGFGGPGG